MTSGEGDTFELEAKLPVADLQEVETALNSLGARLIGRWRETDSFFDFTDRRLKDADSALRLRQRTDQANGESRWRLTFKGPTQPGRFKRRREIEVDVDRPDATESLLESLGLARFISYTKQRSSFAYHNCRIELDQLDGIGTFVEVEGDDESAISAVVNDLDLDRRPSITQSYLAMVIEHRSDGSAEAV